MTSFRLFSKYASFSKAGRYLRDFAYWPFIVLTWLPGIIFFKGHIGEVTSITGESMHPLFNPNINKNLKRDLCWTKKWDPTAKLKRGTVVSLRNPLNPEILQIKRIIALEGDTVSTRKPCPTPAVKVPRNHVWVEGDNEDATKTLDSNTYGPIPVNLIQGIITHILLPLGRCGQVVHSNPKCESRVIEGQKEDAPGWFDEA
ncbi:hypothetical protein K3495_g1927 [Podosphaera aphanis]|nr:hypothetical protein K3495_g1927 [Podosphaera aphanis]